MSNLCEIESDTGDTLRQGSASSPYIAMDPWMIDMSDTVKDETA